MLILKGPAQGIRRSSNWPHCGTAALSDIYRITGKSSSHTAAFASALCKPVHIRKARSRSSRSLHSSTAFVSPCCVTHVAALAHQFPCCDWLEYI